VFVFVCVCVCVCVAYRDYSSVTDIRDGIYKVPVVISFAKCLLSSVLAKCLLSPVLPKCLL